MKPFHEYSATFSVSLHDRDCSYEVFLNILQADDLFSFIRQIPIQKVCLETKRIRMVTSIKRIWGLIAFIAFFAVRSTIWSDKAIACKARVFVALI